MKQLVTLGFSAGIMVALLMWVSTGLPALGIIPWVCLISAGAYFTAGGGLAGLKDPMLAGTMAILLTTVTLFLVAKLGGGVEVLAPLVGLLAFSIVILSRISLFSYIPAAFMAASAYVGAGGDFDLTIIYVIASWGVGLLLAWAIDNLSRILSGQFSAASHSES